MAESKTVPEDAQIAITLSNISYLDVKGSQDQQRAAMAKVLENPTLPTKNEWRIVWGPVTVEENLSFIAEGPVAGSGPARKYAYVIRGTVMEPWNLFEDLLDSMGLHDVPWDGFPGAQISDGMVIGWHNLTAASDGGKTALEFLRGVLPGSQLTVTGHSLGAMLATVMAVYCDRELRPNLQVVPYTFAAPTAGNQAFADAYGKLFGGAGRYFNCLDLIPKGFQHDDLESVKLLYPCDGAPLCQNLFACRHLVDLAQDIAGHRYFHAVGGTRLQAKVYSEKTGSLKNFAKEALDQHHAMHYMWLLDISLEAIHVLDPSWLPPDKECPCPD